jgi:hydrogenase maturation protease
VIPTAAGETILVVGLGNPLMEDDGFGCVVIDHLQRLGLPPGVSAEVIPDVLHLRSLWRGQSAVWMVDAVQVGAPAGTVHRFDHDALLELPADAASAHHLPFAESLRWLLHANPDLRSVRFRLWGAEPAGLSARQGLNPALTAAVGPVVREILGMASRRTIAAAGSASGAVP